MAATTPHPTRFSEDLGSTALPRDELDVKPPTATTSSTPALSPTHPHDFNDKREDAVPHDSDSDIASLRQTGTQTSEMRRIASLNKAVSLPREILVVGIICLSQLLTQVGFSNTLVLLHVIGRSFGVTNPGMEAWLVAGYSLTVGTFILVFGRMG